MSGDVDAIKAEARAVEAGAHAFRHSDGSYTVRSFSRPGIKHTVRPELIGLEFTIRLRCTCESGSARMSAPVPCQHSATVGRRLEREGWATWTAGRWVATERLLRAKGLASVTDLWERQEAWRTS